RGAGQPCRPVPEAEGGRVMKIAIDYDGTWTEDPAFWRDFIASARRAGHECRIVTYRDDRFDRTPELAALEAEVGVIYTRGIAKRRYCNHFGEGFVPDVWVDDTPEALLQNSPTPPAALRLWREERDEEAA